MLTQPRDDHGPHPPHHGEKCCQANRAAFREDLEIAIVRVLRPRPLTLELWVAHVLLHIGAQSDAADRRVTEHLPRNTPPLGAARLQVPTFSCPRPDPAADPDPRSKN